jgi:hypothetical protein
VPSAGEAEDAHEHNSFSTKESKDSKLKRGEKMFGFLGLFSLKYLSEL